MTHYEPSLEELAIKYLHSAHLYPPREGDAGVQLFLLYLNEELNQLNGTRLSFTEFEAASVWIKSNCPRITVVDHRSTKQPSA